MKNLLLVLISFISTGIFAQSGNVFNDLNGNGIKEAGEPGVQGIIVKSYTNGEGMLGTATTDSLGNYILSNCAATNQKVRLEFSTPATLSYLKPSTKGNIHGSSVKFINGNQSNVNFAVCNPTKNLNGDPILIHSRYTFGNQLTGENKDTCVLLGVRNSWGTNTPVDGSYSAWHTNSPYRVAFAKEVGSVYGVVYSKKRNMVYTSAFFRQFSGFGPNGPGAIYKIPYNFVTGNRTASPSLMVDVTTLTGQSMPADPHDTDIPANYSAAPLSSDTRIEMVTKYSLGDLEISDDETKIYTVNLSNREVIAINPDNGSLMGRWPVPTSGLTNNLGVVNANEVRPFALAYKNGKLYVGAVCTGQSTQTSNGTATGALGDKYALHAYVWELNETTGVFTLVLNFQIRAVSAKWKTWQDSWANGLRLIQPSYSEINVPQPILADLDFYGNDMIIGLRNRSNDQWSIYKDDQVSGTSAYTTQWGDILGAKYVHATGKFEIENNGIIGNRTATGTGGSLAGYTEFYRGDGATNSGWDAHFETASGSFAQVNGGNLASLQNFPSFSFNMWPDGDHAGVTWINNETGNATKAISSYLGDLWTCPAGKTNGLGAIEAVADAMPIEVGNRVWYDADGNGLQSADENGYANITLELLNASGTTVLGTTVTDANGSYLFNETNVAGGILPNTTYKIRIAGSQYSSSGGWGTLAGTTVTANNVPGTGLAGVADNDAVNSSGMAVITFTTGGIGESNHDLDFGMKSNLLAVSNIVNFTAVKVNETVQLKWNTSFEQDVAGFVVERATEANNWVAIGNVQAAGNSTVIRNYAFNDMQPLKAKSNLYRLKIMDTDGSFHYSETRLVKMQGAQNISLYPNPAKSITNLSLPASLQGQFIQVQMVNAAGKVVKKVQIASANSNESIVVSDLATGMYTFAIQTKTELLQTLKIQVIK